MPSRRHSSLRRTRRRTTRRTHRSRRTRRRTTQRTHRSRCTRRTRRSRRTRNVSGGRTSRRSRKRYTRKRTTRKRRHRTMSHIPKNRTCSQLLQQKIAINLREYKLGRFVSPQQAIAVAYSQLGKMYPSCKAVFTKKRMSRR